MTHRQHPLGSPFSAASTADEVLAGLDLTGRYAVVTGGHAGIGLEVVRALHRAGASVTVGARDVERAGAALAELKGVEVDRLNLVDHDSIDAFAGRWLDTGRPLQMLVNNAGASGGPERDARATRRSSPSIISATSSSPSRCGRPCRPRTGRGS